MASSGPGDLDGGAPNGAGNALILSSATPEGMAAPKNTAEQLWLDTFTTSLEADTPEARDQASEQATAELGYDLTAAMGMTPEQSESAVRYAKDVMARLIPEIAELAGVETTREVRAMIGRRWIELLNGHLSQPQGTVFNVHSEIVADKAMIAAEVRERYGAAVSGDATPAETQPTDTRVLLPLKAFLSVRESVRARLLPIVGYERAMQFASRLVLEEYTTDDQSALAWAEQEAKDAPFVEVLPAEQRYAPLPDSWLPSMVQSTTGESAPNRDTAFLDEFSRRLELVQTRYPGYSVEQQQTIAAHMAFAAGDGRVPNISAIRRLLIEPIPELAVQPHAMVRLPELPPTLALRSQHLQEWTREYSRVRDMRLEVLALAGGSVDTHQVIALAEADADNILRARVVARQVNAFYASRLSQSLFAKA